MNNIGNKIRNYRVRQKVSQLDLELKANMSSGSISRIENGTTNPTKETIADISLALKLNAHEIANLYGIDAYNPAELIKSTTNLFKSKNIEKLSKYIVDDLIFKLGYIASAFFTVEGEFIVTRGITKTNISEVTFELLGDIPIESIKWEINDDNPSALVKSLISKEYTVVPRDSDYLFPALPMEIADEIQARTGDDKTLIYPIFVGEEVKAILVIASKVHTDFQDDVHIIDAIAEQIGLALKSI